MRYANFCDCGRCNINLGDYLQFMAAGYLYEKMGIPADEIVPLRFDDLAGYDGDNVVLPFCYSIIDFVAEGKIAISNKIKPIFFSVTLSTVDKFMDLDEFFSDEYNSGYLLKHSPIGCRDEITYNMFTKHNIPAYINGCMTAIFPKYTGAHGSNVLLVDAPKALLPFIPKNLLKKCVFSTQQYHFSESDIKDYRKVFEFVRSKYCFYRESAALAVTSRLHVALPLAAFGIPAILAKDFVDGRFSFIERYIPIYSKENYVGINWTPQVPDFDDAKELLIEHALGRILNNVENSKLERMEQTLTEYFQSRAVSCEYADSHAITHQNGYRFEQYAAQYWNSSERIKYAFWGVSKNNAEYWKNYIESRYPLAELTAVFDSFREGELFGFPFQHPERIAGYADVNVIVCSVGAAETALKLFKRACLDRARYCVTSDCFISSDDIAEVRTA